MFVEPLPPGAIDRNASDFHPEKLHLKWTAPGNRTHVDRYDVSIDGHYYAHTSNNEMGIHRLEPGRIYNISIVNFTRRK